MSNLPCMQRSIVMADPEHLCLFSLRINAHAALIYQEGQNLLPTDRTIVLPR